MNGKPAAEPTQEFMQAGIRMRNGGKAMVLMAALKISLGLVVILALLGLILYAIAIKPPRVPQGDVSRDEVTSYIEKVIASRSATAMSVAVIRDGEVIWEQAAGQANPFEDRAATTASVYHVWSVTKVATALAVLDLAEDGLLAPGEEWVQESVIGSTYRASYRKASGSAIVPTITGQAFVTSDATLKFDPADPYRAGIRL